MRNIADKRRRPQRGENALSAEEVADAAAAARVAEREVTEQVRREALELQENSVDQEEERERLRRMARARRWST